MLSSYIIIFSSILERFLEILLCDWTNCVLLFFYTCLMANIGVGIDYEILNKCLSTLSDIGVSQIQHFFLYVNLK